MATIAELPEKKPSLFTQGCFIILFGVMTCVFVIITGLFTKCISTDLYHAVKLSEQGISVSAVVLDSKNTYIRYRYSAYTSHDHYIRYRNYHNKITLDRTYPIGSIVNVLYDRDDPSFVWQGRKDMSIWKLYFLNSEAYGDPFALLYLHAGYLFTIGMTYFVGKVCLSLIREYRDTARAEQG